MSGWKRTALAATLAYALVLQGVLLALSGAMHVQAAEGPQAILCLQDADAGSPQTPDRTDHGLCCLAGCTSSAGAAGPVPIQALPQTRLPVPTTMPVMASRPPAIVSSNVLPVGSRAPPRLG